MHEFLVLHYLATDSAREWDVFLDSCLPACTWVRAGSRRALALHMYDKCHIAPSHRRFAHPSWIAGMKLMLDLLLGARKDRYLKRCLSDPRPAQVYVRGFSQMVPVQSPCQSRRRRFASSYRIAERSAWGEWDVEYTLNATKLFWSRSGIMHVAIAWDHKPLLLLATALLPNRTTESFEREAGPPYDKQRIQMGLRSGNTVLICFRSGVGHFQSVLIAFAADLHATKPWQGQHKFWKYVSPIRTYFAWLPERLARTHCSAALDRCPDLPYGEVHPLAGE